MRKDLVENIYNLNKELVGKNAYIIISDNSIIAATSKYDLNNYLEEDECVLTPDLGDELTEAKIIYGYVFDIEELPYELPKEIEDKSMFLLIDSTQQSIAVYECSSIEEATGWVEFHIEDEGLDIEDFALIVGEELSFNLTVTETGSHISPLIFK